jgi:hypothetical protein
MNPTVTFLLHSELVHFVLYIVAIAFIGGMPAPTATSSIVYRWAFTTLNIIAANIHRGVSTSVESSPNFQAALNKQQAVQGQQQTPVIPLPPAEAPKP